MGSRAESGMLSASSVAPGETARSPFWGPGLWARVAPFAVVAVLAEASLLLPSGTESGPAALASLLLLLLAGAGFLLPWARLPGWMTVLVPLTYTGSVLALDLAAGSTSGVGIVILIPLVWTALFHRPWESVCVVAAIVGTEVIVSLTPVTVPDAVITRRVIFWTALAALISLATHGLRDRIQRSRERGEKLQSRLRELTVLADRDRIAADLRDTVIQRIFAVGLTLQSTASRVPPGEVRDKIGASVGELDQTVRMLRDAIFALEQRPGERGLRQEIMELCARLSPTPEISFTGPVDTVAAEPRGQLVAMLTEALGPVRRNAVAARIGISAGNGSCRTTIEAGPVPGIPSEELTGLRGEDFTRFQDRGAEAGIHVDVRAIPEGVRVAWQVPCGPRVPAAGSLPSARRAWRSAAVQRAVQVHGRADQGQMGQRLREVAQRLSGGADLLGVKTEMVGVGEHFLEDGPGFLEPPGAGERLDIPERAEVEGALTVGDTVVAGDRVPGDQAVGGELGADPVQRRQEARIGRPGELHQRHHQDRGVEQLAAGVHDVRAQSGVPAGLLHVAMGGRGELAPALDRPGQATVTGQARGPVVGDPAEVPDDAAFLDRQIARRRRLGAMAIADGEISHPSIIRACITSAFHP
jgi:signal transduction histidine kinase